MKRYEPRENYILCLYDKHCHLSFRCISLMPSCLMRQLSKIATELCDIGSSLLLLCNFIIYPLYAVYCLIFTVSIAKCWTKMFLSAVSILFHSFVWAICYSVASWETFFFSAISKGLATLYVLLCCSLSINFHCLWKYFVSKVVFWLLGLYACRLIPWSILTTVHLDMELKEWQNMLKLSGFL